MYKLLSLLALTSCLFMGCPKQRVITNKDCYSVHRYELYNDVMEKFKGVPSKVSFSRSEQNIVITARFYNRGGGFCEVRFSGVNESVLSVEKVSGHHLATP